MAMYQPGEASFGRGPRREPPDQVDVVLAEWTSGRPGAEFDPIAFTARISRLAQILQQRIERTCSRFGLDWGQFLALTALRGAGAPYRMSPRELHRLLRLSPAAVTNRLYRLEAKGLIERGADPADQRSLPVVLTPLGLSTVERAMAACLEAERGLLAESAGRRHGHHGAVHPADAGGIRGLSVAAFADDGTGAHDGVVCPGSRRSDGAGRVDDADRGRPDRSPDVVAGDESGAREAAAPARAAGGRGGAVALDRCRLSDDRRCLRLAPVRPERRSRRLGLGRGHRHAGRGCHRHRHGDTTGDSTVRERLSGPLDRPDPRRRHPRARRDARHHRRQCRRARPSTAAPASPCSSGPRSMSRRSA